MRRIYWMVALVGLMSLGSESRVWAADPTAADLFKEAIAAAGQMHESTHFVNEKGDTLATVIVAKIKMGDLDGAKATIKQFSGEIGNGYSSLLIATALADAGDVEGAKGMADLVADPHVKAGIYASVVDSQARQGKIADAKTTAKLVDDVNFKSMALVCVAEAQATAGDLDGAMQAIAAITDAPDQQVCGYTAIAIMQAKAGKQTDAMASLELAKTAAKQVPDFLRLMSLGEIAAAQIKAGDAKGAAHTLDGDSDPGDRNHICGEIAKAQIDMGYFQAAADTAKNLTDDYGITNIDVMLSGAESKAGDTPAAKQYLEAAMTQAAKISTSTSLAYLYQDLGRMQAKLLGTAAAVQRARSQSDPQVRAYALVGVAQGLGK